jgi:hypothetical protein
MVAATGGCYLVRLENLLDRLSTGDRDASRSRKAEDQLAARCPGT